MNENYVSCPVTPIIALTESTYNKLFTLIAEGKNRYENALALYLFYLKKSLKDKTNRIWAVNNFVLNGLGWSKPKLQRTKKDLADLDLIKQIGASGKNTKAYIELRYLVNSNKKDSLGVQNNYQEKETPGNESEPKCLKNINKKCLKNKKESFSKEKQSDSSQKKVSVGKSKKGQKKLLLNKTMIDEYKKKEKKKKKQEKQKKKKLLLKGVPTIDKNKPIKNQTLSRLKGKTKYSVSEDDLAIYMELIDLGGTKHRVGSNSELSTINKIHALLSPHCSSPFDHILCDYSKKVSKIKWTKKKLIRCFEFQMQRSVNPTKNIGNFILNTFRDHYSPLLRTAQIMLEEKKNKKKIKETSSSLGRTAMELKYWTEKLGISPKGDENNGIFAKAGYVMDNILSKYEVMPNITHIYPNISSLYAKFIQDKISYGGYFVLPFITSEKNIQEFIHVGIRDMALREKRNKRVTY